MKNTLSLLVAAAALAAVPASADGTLEGSVNFGGAISYETTTIAGSEFDIDLHGGVFAADSVFAGGDLMLRDNQAVTAWEVTAMGRFHFLDPLLTDEGGAIAAFSPYVGLRLGYASCDTTAKDESGLVLAARIGTNFFITENFALDFYVDGAAATADVYADKSKMESTDVRVHLGFDFFF